MTTFKHMIQMLFITIALGLVSNSLHAQTQQSVASDLNLGLGYEPEEIVSEWDEWYTNPTQENAFIADFMQQYDVPQTGLHGLTRLETWTWWTFHHQTEVNAYITLRDQQNN